MKPYPALLAELLSAELSSLRQKMALTQEAMAEQLRISSRCGSRVSPSLQITVRTAGDKKLLRHRFLRQRHLLPQGRQFRGKKLREQRRVWFHPEDLHSL